jgi:hypothetical protein
MVCQANHEWELIDGCPATPIIVNGKETFEGLGCLGGNATCGDCACSSVDGKYHCCSR